MMLATTKSVTATKWFDEIPVGASDISCVVRFSGEIRRGQRSVFDGPLADGSFDEVTSWAVEAIELISCVTLGGDEVEPPAHWQAIVAKWLRDERGEEIKELLIVEGS